MNTPTPLPVQVVSTPTDWLSVTSTIAGVLALAIAIMALIVTRNQRTAAIRHAAAERRQIFELDVLRELLVLLRDSSQVADGRARGLIAVLPDDFPLWRKIWNASAMAPTRTP